MTYIIVAIYVILLHVKLYEFPELLKVMSSQFCASVLLITKGGLHI